VWQPRPADPELEAEFLRRLMVKLGVSQSRPSRGVAPGTAKSNQPAWPRWAACPWCRLTKALTAPGAVWAWRWTAPASPWKTATAARAPTSCAMWRTQSGQERAWLLQQTLWIHGHRSASTQVPYCAQEHSRLHDGHGAQCHRWCRVVCQRPAHCHSHCRRPEITPGEGAPLLRFRSLGSGSTGNATVVEASSGTLTTRILDRLRLGHSRARCQAGPCGSAHQRPQRYFHHPRTQRPYRLRSPGGPA
jgi:hypothetical protein